MRSTNGSLIILHQMIERQYLIDLRHHFLIQVSFPYVSSSGFASVENSFNEATSTYSLIIASNRSSCFSDKEVGVPPPRNTVSIC